MSGEDGNIGGPAKQAPAKTSMKAKHQRLLLVLIALAAMIGAGFLAAWALSNQASYFYLPAEMKANSPATGQAVRLGGMVQKGSLTTLADGVTVTFIVTDKDSAVVPVRYSGILPDLFAEGSGVVAEGRLAADGTFVADNLLAKHDENYVPRELQGMDQHKTDKTLILEEPSR